MLPEAEFAMAHTGASVEIKFFIKEKTCMALCSSDQQSVCKDSCVEFFCSPPDSAEYYNFEFNAAGICLAARGVSRENRIPLTADQLVMIKRRPSMAPGVFSEKTGNIIWNLHISIPSVIFGPERYNLSGNIFSANLYKCGDHLSNPHWLCWKKVETPQPDFHRPEYFTRLEFMPA